jgi:hypothetical protein
MRGRPAVSFYSGALDHAFTVALICAVATSLATSSPRTAAQSIDFVSNGIGVPPADFEFWRTGQGTVGDWAVVRDPSAIAGASIEQFSTDLTEDRFPVAIYKPTSAKDVKVSFRFKIVRGSMRSAGIAMRLRTASDYYLVRVSALEERVDLVRVVNGKMERVAGADADVMSGRWQTLGVAAADTWAVEVVPNPDKNVAFIVHAELQTKHGILNHENLVFDELIADRKYQFVYVFTPSPIKGATGSNGCPIAVT